GGNDGAARVAVDAAEDQLPAAVQGQRRARAADRTGNGQSAAGGRDHHDVAVQRQRGGDRLAAGGDRDARGGCAVVEVQRAAAALADRETVIAGGRMERDRGQAWTG